jgi:RNA polymerase sigma factor (sigma-70 family)
VDLETLETTDKRGTDWFNTVMTPETQGHIMAWLKQEYSATDNLWPVVWQEVLIAIWLNCPENAPALVADDVTRRWLAAERKRLQRQKYRQEDLEGEVELPTVEQDSWDLEPYLEHLTDQQRVVVTARYEYGMTEQEIAEQVGMSQPAVSQMLKRVKKTLREKINEG